MPANLSIMDSVFAVRLASAEQIPVFRGNLQVSTFVAIHNRT